MAKGQGKTIPVEEREALRWTVGQRGFGDETAPAVRIVIVERLNEQTREAVDYKAKAELCSAPPLGGAAAIWINHMPGADSLHYFKEQRDAFLAAKRALTRVVYQQFCDALDRGNQLRVEQLNGLRQTMRDEALLELARQREKPRVTYTFMTDADLLLARRLRQEHPL